MNTEQESITSWSTCTVSIPLMISFSPAGRECTCNFTSFVQFWVNFSDIHLEVGCTALATVAAELRITGRPDCARDCLCLCVVSSSRFSEEKKPLAMHSTWSMQLQYSARECTLKEVEQLTCWWHCSNTRDETEPQRVIFSLLYWCIIFAVCKARKHRDHKNKPIQWLTSKISQIL